MRAPSPVLTACLASLLALVGISWLTMLNVQLLTNGLGCLSCLLASLYLCLRGFRYSQQLPRLRFFWGTAVSVLTLSCVLIAAALPKAYRQTSNVQQTFDAVEKMLREQSER